LVLFPTKTKGFSVGKKLKKIGNLASDTAELFFDECACRCVTSWANAIAAFTTSWRISRANGWCVTGRAGGHGQGPALGD